MIHRVRHTHQALTRFLAFALIVLFSTVRIVALLHTHDHDGTSEYRIKPVLAESYSHSPFTTTNNHNASEENSSDDSSENCSLCDLLLHSHGEAASGVVFAMFFLPVPSCEAVSVPEWNAHHSALILADRAPPAFLAFA